MKGAASRSRRPVVLFLAGTEKRPARAPGPTWTRPGGGPGRQASAVADLERGMSKDLIVRLIEVTTARSRIGQTARSCGRKCVRPRVGSSTPGVGARSSGSAGNRSSVRAWGSPRRCRCSVARSRSLRWDIWHSCSGGHIGDDEGTGGCTQPWNAAPRPGTWSGCCPGRPRCSSGSRKSAAARTWRRRPTPRRRSTATTTKPCSLAARAWPPARTWGDPG